MRHGRLCCLWDITGKEIPRSFGTEGTKHPARRALLRHRRHRAGHHRRGSVICVTAHRRPNLYDAFDMAPYAAFIGVYIALDGVLEALVGVSHVSQASVSPLGWMVALAVALVSVAAARRVGRIGYIGLLWSVGALYVAVWCAILGIEISIPAQSGHAADLPALINNMQGLMLRTFAQVIVLPLIALAAIRWMSRTRRLS